MNEQSTWIIESWTSSGHAKRYNTAGQVYNFTKIGWYIFHRYHRVLSRDEINIFYKWSKENLSHHWAVGNKYLYIEHPDDLTLFKLRWL